MKKSRKTVNHIAWLLFVIYIMLLSYFLFFSEKYGRMENNSEYRYNLHLFQEIKRFIIYRKEVGFESFMVNILGNVLAFTPFGFVLPIISPSNRKFFNILILSFELTLGVELMQLLLKVGIFDVDDLLMNTVGGVLGYILFIIARSIYYKVWKGKSNV
ncbi:glycopeptide antibiotics resistance protein [Mobilisporobacter senegalensis]|uniref:Glycopeptide antibiotics resistance protein n=1 Tax=Mobilisporobacter senegalensis TaxID=1329262 RepID=A0A3N1XY14_9FIRM|nr:glycopeptide antibiotics resistance protein [Mobilisporobacter senegalensis]